MRSSRSPLRYELALLGVVAIWGCNFTVMKVAVERVDPLLFNAARFTLSVVFLGALHARSARRGGPGGEGLWPPRALAGTVLGLGLVGHVGYQAGFVLGLARTTSGTSALLIASAPLWTGLLGHLTGIEVLLRRAWLGLVLAFLGTALIATASGLAFGREVLIGNLVTAGAAACWGAYTVWNRPHLVRHSPGALAFWTMLAALPFLWLLAWPGLGALDPAAVDGAVVVAGLYSGLFGTGVAYVLWNVGVRQVGPARTATATYLVPLVTLTLGVVWLEEPVGPIQLGGGALVLFGLALMGRGRRPRAVTQEGGETPRPEIAE